MAEEKTTQASEKEYVIPLRRAWLNVPEYKRTRKAIKTIKQFIARHMKIQDRNLDNVKLDVYLNNDIWFRGKANPPSKIKVKAAKEGDIVHVRFADTPQHVKLLKVKHNKMHKKVEEKKEEKTEGKSEEKKQEKPEEKEKTEEQKKDESEKVKAVEQQNIKQAETQAKIEKHFTKTKEPKIQRMALKK